MYNMSIVIDHSSLDDWSTSDTNGESRHEDL